MEVAGQWITMNPREWRNKFGIQVNVGLGTGNKDQQVAHLMQLIGVQQMALQVGFAQPQNLYESAVRMAENLQLPNPEKFFTDPQKMPPRQAPPPPEVIKAQAMMQVEQMKGQLAAQVEQLRLQADLQKSQADLDVQASNDQRDMLRSQQEAELRAQLEAAKQENDRAIAQMRDATERFRAELDAQVKLQIAGMQHEAQQAPQIDTSGLQRMEQAMQSLMTAVTAPKRLIRDPNTGRAIGAEVVMPNTSKEA